MLLPESMKPEHKTLQEKPLNHETDYEKTKLKKTQNPVLDTQGP